MEERNINSRRSSFRIGLSVILLMCCSPSTPKLVLPSAPQSVTDVTKIHQNFTPQVDILFVIANDSSMEDKQKVLAQNAAQFTAAIFQNQVLDYHIGVINAVGAQQQGYNGIYGGRLYPVDQGNPNIYANYIDRSTPNAQAALTKNLNVGYSADDPMALFDVVRRALTQPIINQENVGFFRPNAPLAIIFISDTDPEDPTAADNPDIFYKFLLNLKNGDAKKVSVYGVYDFSANAYGPGDGSGAPPGDCGGESAPYMLDRLMVLAAPNSSRFYLCDTKFGQQLASLSSKIVNSSTATTIELSQRPVVSSINVFYGTYSLPNDASTGWVYDPVSNSLVIGANVTWPTNQPGGTELQVSYKAAALPAQTN